MVTRTRTASGGLGHRLHQFVCELGQTSECPCVGGVFHSGIACGVAAHECGMVLAHDLVVDCLLFPGGNGGNHRATFEVNPPQNVFSRMKPLRLLFTALILLITHATNAQVVSVFLSEGSVAINADASVVGPTSLLLYPEDAFQFSEDAQGFLQEDDGQIQWVELSNLNTFEALLEAGEEEGFFSQIMHLIFTEGVILDEDEVEMAGAVRGFGMAGGDVAMRFQQRWNSFRIASDTLVIKAEAYGDLVEKLRCFGSSGDAPSLVKSSLEVGQSQLRNLAFMHCRLRGPSDVWSQKWSGLMQSRRKS